MWKKNRETSLLLVISLSITSFKASTGQKNNKLPTEKRPIFEKKLKKTSKKGGYFLPISGLPSACCSWLYRTHWKLLAATFSKTSHCQISVLAPLVAAFYLSDSAQCSSRKLRAARMPGQSADWLAHFLLAPAQDVIQLATLAAHWP